MQRSSVKEETGGAKNSLKTADALRWKAVEGELSKNRDQKSHSPRR